MSAQYWWVWIIVAAVFAVAEILTAGFFLLWFGVGAAVAGVLALLGMGAAWQLGAFVVISFALFLWSRRFADRFSKQQPPGIGADRLAGKQAVVIERIDNAGNTGRVRLDREEWRAESATGHAIAKGANVVVTRVEGTRVVVKTAELGSEEGA